LFFFSSLNWLIDWLIFNRTQINTQHRKILKKILNNVNFQRIQLSLSKWKWIQTKMKFQTQFQHWHIFTLSNWLELNKKWKWIQSHHYTIKFKHVSLCGCDWHQIWMTNQIQSTHWQNFNILNCLDVKSVNWMKQSPTWHHFKHCYLTIMNWIDFHPQWQS
jgi:hypothetical protein